MTDHESRGVTHGVLESHASLFENSLNLEMPHLVEVVWNGDLPRHKAESLHPIRSRSIDCGDFDEGFSGLGDDEWFSFGSLIDQL